MPTNTPILGLPKGNGTDNARDYLKGAIAGGGLWRALEILDNAILSTASITLDNATLNNPTITGSWANAQHTHASAAQAGSTLGPGVTLSSPAFAGVVSTGAQFAGNVGVGVAPAAWGSVIRAVQVGQGAVFRGATSNAQAVLATNTVHDGTTQKALVSGASGQVILNGGSLEYYNAPSVAAGATQTFTTRLQVAQNGTVTLTPDAGQSALTWNTGVGGLVSGSGSNPRVFAAAGTSLEIQGSSGYVTCGVDNNNNLGHPSVRWSTVYAATGTINTSLAEAKQDITPLSPEAALAAVRATDPVVFDYRPPERGPEWYELPDDPEQAAAVLEQRLRAAPLEEGARHQAGFLLDDPTGTYTTDPLFETGEGQSNAANSVGVLLAALKAIDTRVTQLEGAA